MIDKICEKAADVLIFILIAVWIACMIFGAEIKIGDFASFKLNSMSTGIESIINAFK